MFLIKKEERTGQMWLYKKPGADSLVIRDMDGRVLNVIEEQNPLSDF
jgi:hypothetical protein